MNSDQYRKKHSSLIASGLILLQCLIFGFSFSFSKSLLDNSFPVIFLLFIRFAIGSFFLLIIGAVTGKLKSISLNDIKGGAILGLLLFFAFFLQTFGLEYTTPAKCGLFTDLFVIFVPIITILQTKKVNWRVFISAVLAFVGAGILSNAFSATFSFSIGDLLSVLCGLVLAFHFVITEKYALKHDPNDVVNPYVFTSVQLIVTSLLSLVLSMLLENNQYNTLDWNNSILNIVFLGVFSTGIAYLLQFFAQNRISAETTSVLSCSEALFTLVISLVLGFDSFSYTLLFGGLIMISGMVYSIIPSRESK